MKITTIDLLFIAAALSVCLALNLTNDDYKIRNNNVVLGAGILPEVRERERDNIREAGSESCSPEPGNPSSPYVRQVHFNPPESLERKIQGEISQRLNSWREAHRSALSTVGLTPEETEILIKAVIIIKEKQKAYEQHTR
jgi:hypothetical protein